MQFRSLDVVMNCMLAMPVSQVSMVCRLFLLLSLIVFCCIVEMVGGFLVITSGIVVMLPSFRHVILLWKILAPDGDGTHGKAAACAGSAIPGPALPEIKPQFVVR